MMDTFRWTVSVHRLALVSGYKERTRRGKVVQTTHRLRNRPGFTGVALIEQPAFPPIFWSDALCRRFVGQLPTGGIPTPRDDT